METSWAEKLAKIKKIKERKPKKYLASEQIDPKIIFWKV